MINYNCSYVYVLAYIDSYIYACDVIIGLLINYAAFVIQFINDHVIKDIRSVL